VSPEQLQQLLLSTFADEATDRLRRLEELLAAGDGDGDALREAHNLKGAARAAELPQVEALAHRLEGCLLDNPEAALPIVEAIRELVRGIRVERTAPPLIEALQQLVGSLARELGKHVELELVGGDVALDDRLAQALRDPLGHLLRNCLDHGLEATGRLRIGISAHDGEIEIELADDGVGIDLARVRARAVELGIASAQAAAGMDDRDALALIFCNGLSTRDEVTSLSGRGVGMDAARESVRALGGTLDVSSAPGVGTTFMLRVPAHACLEEAA
jgi:chemotaxis protein histidine kinase CheA